jgi:outer membrane lipoprotein SlyB
MTDMKKTLLLIAVVATATTGCTHLQDLSWLKDDKAKVTIDIGTVYGTIHFVRDGSENGAATTNLPALSHSADGSTTIK